MSAPKKVVVDLSNLSFARQDANGLRYVLRDFNAQIFEGEFVSIVGPSGCGKSTLISLLCGGLSPAAGSIGFPQGRPKLGIQFQSDALFPWRPVWSNLGYPLEIAGQNKAARRAHAASLCELVRLSPPQFLDRYPSELSGGERRRVSLAMALSAGPSLLLLDEASGSLDWFTRRAMQEMLQQLSIERSLTTVSVTHDIEEAVWLSDRVLVMRNGACKKELIVNLPRPRTDTMRSDQQFAEKLKQIVDSLS